MKRIDLYIDDTLYEHIKTFPGTISETVRRALYELVQKERALKVSASSSKKEGDN